MSGVDLIGLEACMSTSFSNRKFRGCALIAETNQEQFPSPGSTFIKAVSSYTDPVNTPVENSMRSRAQVFPLPGKVYRTGGRRGALVGRKVRFPNFNSHSEYDCASESEESRNRGRDDDCTTRLGE